MANQSFRLHLIRSRRCTFSSLLLTARPSRPPPPPAPPALPLSTGARFARSATCARELGAALLGGSDFLGAGLFPLILGDGLMGIKSGQCW